MADATGIAEFLHRYASLFTRWTQPIPEPTADEAAARERVAAGEPWIASADVRLDPEAARRVLHELLAALRPVSEAETDNLERLRNLTQQNEFSPVVLLRAVMERDRVKLTEIAAAADMPLPILQFLGAYLVRPFLHRAGSGFPAAGVTMDRADASCPRCGHAAASAYLMPEERQRRLWCRHCGGDWPVRRIKCPGCGNTDPHTLGYFTLEGDVGRRVDFCRRCRRYIKSFDLAEQAGEPIQARADRDDLLSGELDVAAVHEGYAVMAAPVGAEQR